jgi:hypothetical protein
MGRRAAATATAALPLEAPAAAAIVAPGPDPNRLRLHRLTVKGYAGFGDEPASFDFDPAVTILRGQNASRKSSILAAIRCGLGIERIAASRRAHIDGADGSHLVPEIELWLQGADREVHLRRRGDGSPEVRERVGEDWRQVPRGAEYLRDLVDAQGAVPATFLQASTDERATILLEALELPGYTRADAMARAELVAFRLPPIPDGLHPLEDIEEVIKAVASARTEVGRQRETEHQTAKKLLSGIPAQAPGDVAAEITRVEGETDAQASELAWAEAEADAGERATVATARQTHEAEETRVKDRFKAEADRVRSSHAERVAEWRAELERRIKEDLAASDRAVETLREDSEKQLESTDAARDAVISQAGLTRAEARARHESARKELAAGREKLAALRAQQQAVETDRHVRTQAKDSSDKAAAHEKRWNELTEAIEALRRYAVELAGSLPIKGLEVRYDEKGKRVVLLDKVPLDQVNDGRLQELADEVSLLHAAARGTSRPYLPIVLVDWLERVDEARRAAHLRGLSERGAQVVAAVVGEGPLQVVHGAAA